MISSDQSQPTVKHWITCFRNDEKRIYGNPCKSTVIVQWYLLLQKWKFFSNENLLSFLKRSWKIVHGDASLEELKMTIAHTCAFHFMKNSKEIVKKKLPVSNRKTEMWILSLLMNRGNMQDLERPVKLVVIMCSKFITPRVHLCIGTLNKLIKYFKANISDEAKEYIGTACVEAGSHPIHKKKSDYQSEEDFYMKCEVSPFKRHFSEIYQVQLASIENSDKFTLFTNVFCNYFK